MRGAVLATCFTVAALCSAAPTLADPSRAAEVLARARSAQGGAQWDAVRSLKTTATVKVAGLEGINVSLEDLQTGHFADRYDLRVDRGATGYDGKSPWNQDASGHSRVEAAVRQQETAVNEAYRRSRAYWYPARAAAAIDSAGEQKDERGRYDVVRIVPKGGRAFNLWVDKQTGLFDRVVEVNGPETTTTYLSDYRDVGGVKLPYTQRVSTGEAKYDQLTTVTSIDVNVPVDAAQFAPPAPPPPDSGFAAGATTTTVPFRLINNHIYVEVKLNGKGPYSLLMDTGGMNIVGPALAAELGLKPEGAIKGGGVGENSEDIGVTHVERLEIGSAYLQNQVFYAIPLDKMSPIEGMPLQGVIGYEVFRRFVTRIDYERLQLTLADPKGWHYQGTGTVIPFVFQEQVPQVEGAIDGIPGKFSLDTGSRSSLDLMSPFVTKHDLLKKYSVHDERVTGWGVGGPSRGYVARAHELQLGTVVIPEPMIELSQATKGTFANPYEAGNVGAGVLKRFNVTFDYERQKVILEKNANFEHRDEYDKSGLWLHLGDGAWDVIEVAKGSPAAAAGIKAGDRILKVGGQTPADLSLSDLRQRLRESPVNTEISLTVQSGQETRVVPLILRDLFCKCSAALLPETQWLI